MEKQYHTNKQWWYKAFAYMRDTDLKNIKRGTYQIEGDNVYAMVTDGPGYYTHS